MIKAVPLFLIVLLLVDATIAVPQEARAELRNKANGVAPVNASPVQTKLYQYKRYNNDDYKHNYKKYHGKKKNTSTYKKSSYHTPTYCPTPTYTYCPTYGDKYLIARPVNDEDVIQDERGDKQLYNQKKKEQTYCETYYPTKTYCETKTPYHPPTKCETKTPYYPPTKCETKTPYHPPTKCETKTPYYPPTKCETYNYQDKYLLSNRADFDVDRQDDWGQNDSTRTDHPRVLLQRHHSHHTSEHGHMRGGKVMAEYNKYKKDYCETTTHHNRDTSTDEHHKKERSHKKHNYKHEYKKHY